MNPKTYTSNISKLLKQMDKLQNIQENKDISPVQIHVAPTNKCNLSCSFCCFADRDKEEEWEYKTLFNLIGDAAYMGVKSIELNGGGEPTLYPYINEAISEIKKQGMNAGLITNGTLLHKLDPSNLNWLRISMN